MDVLGRDSAQGCYRVAIEAPEGRIVGRIPEHIMAAGPLTGGHGHRTAYDWIAAHRGEIEKTLRALKAGQAAHRPPYDCLTLEKE